MGSTKRAQLTTMQINIRTTNAERLAELDYARESAVAPDATLAELSDREWLLARLPALMVEFRAAVESLGFVYEEVSR